jgi:hypothetical protein
MYSKQKVIFVFFSGLSPMKQILFKITIATLITLAVVSVVALPLYFVVFSPAYSEGMGIPLKKIEIFQCLF